MMCQSVPLGYIGPLLVCENKAPLSQLQILNIINIILYHNNKLFKQIDTECGNLSHSCHVNKAAFMGMTLQLPELIANRIKVGFGVW